MTTITIDLPETVVERLSKRAETFKIDLAEMVESYVLRGIQDDDDGEEGWDPSLSPEDIAAIEEGMADAAAGRTIPHEKIMEDCRKLLAG
jgi:predicted transcriptional regulator